MTSPRTKQQDSQRQNSNPSPDRDRSDASKQNQVQGEGNYDATREFDEAERKFVESGNVDAAACAAAPKSAEEEREMLDAESKARSRAKEEDPAVRRPQRGNAKP